MLTSIDPNRAALYRRDAMTSASPLAVKAALPLDQVTIFKGSGSHKLYTATSPDGVRMFAKHNQLNEPWWAGRYGKQLQTFIERTFPNMDRYEDIRENLLSHVARNHFDFPTLVYQEAYFKDPQDGHLFFGLATPFVPGLSDIDQVPVESIRNPRQAVESALVKGCLFGDWDVTFNTGNTAVMQQDATLPDGTQFRKGDNVSLDYGEAGNRGIAMWNVPYGSSRVLRTYPQFIKPAIDKILALSDDQIRTMVDTEGRHNVTGWNDALCHHFTDMLQHNRDRLRLRLSRNPDWFDYSKTDNPLRLDRWEHQASFALGVQALISRVQVARCGLLRTLHSTSSIAESLAASLPAFPSMTAGADL